MARTFAALIAAALLASCAATGAGTAAGDSAASSADIYAAAVADSRRPAADTARDGLRKPAQIVAFAGVKRGDVVAEIAPGGGYYTRILAETVGPQGHVYALIPAFFANRPGGLDAINALAAQYPNVEVVVADYAALNLPRPVDVVWTTENYHDLANGNIAPINTSIFNALKPGGIYFVEDHAAPGTGLTATSTLHRIDPAAVTQQVIRAGFALEAHSELLRNPADPHTANPRDVQPTSDKFALRFRRPN